MQEESMLGLPVIISGNTHLRNTGSDPTYSQFAKHADERSKGFKTSTQDVGLNNTACTLSSGYGQCIDSLELMNNTVPSRGKSVYSPDSLEISNNVPSKPNTSIQVDDDNVEDDSLTKAGSESILTHHFIDRIKQITLVDHITEKKRNNTKENEKSSRDKDESCSDIEVVKENIMPKKSNLNLLSRKSSSTKSTAEHPRLLAEALYEGKIRLPSYCCYKSDEYNYDSSEKEIQSENVDRSTSSDAANMSSDAAITSSHADIVSVTDRPDLPLTSITTFLEIKNNNCHDYTVIPLKLSPELEGDWAEKVVRCVCSKCEKTYVLNDLEKISSVDNDDWPDHKVPVCPNDKCNKQCIEAESAHFYFEMELNAIKIKLTCTAILSSKSAETFLVKDLMKKWKTLRDSFVKDHRTATAPGTGKAASAKKRYVYYDQLQFILPYVKGNQNTASNIAPPASTTSDATNIDAEPDDVTITPNNDSTNDANENSVAQKPSNKRKHENPNVVTGKRAALERSVANSAKELTSILAANLQMQREERTSDKYGHRAFLLSFLPVLENMPFQEAMLLRGQISQVITNHFADKEVPSRSNSALFSAPQTPASDILSETSEDTVFDISQYIKL